MSRPATSLESRFWPKVLKTDGCWEWTGAKGKRGYGNIEVAGKCYSAHRASWALANGPIPENQVVCHRCDNPGCVNPDHLFLGMQADNLADMRAKGRGKTPPVKYGTDTPKHKLDETRVKTIRELYGIGFNQYELAKMYEVSQGLVSAIIRRKAWSHVQ